jgi:hypothetical protein
MTWADKVAIATLIIVSIILMSVIRLAIRFGGI